MAIGVSYWHSALLLCALNIWLLLPCYPSHP
jgi:hypothetical protein